VTRQPLELVTFDIAGTTMADGNLVEQAFLAVFAAHDMAVPEAELLPFRGASKRLIFETMSARYGRGQAAPLDRLMSEFEEELGAHLRRSARAIPGANETFAWLRARGLKVALTTGFSRPTLHLVRELLGWTPELVDAAICSDDVPEARPAPWMIFAAMQAAGVVSAVATMAVGDTPRDLQAGTHAGCGGVVGVLTGAGTVETLGRVRHTHLLASVADLPDLIEREFCYDPAADCGRPS
jgi:phosphonatase-like hydrolase